MARLMYILCVASHSVSGQVSLCVSACVESTLSNRAHAFARQLPATVCSTMSTGEWGAELLNDVYNYLSINPNILLTYLSRDVCGLNFEVSIKGCHTRRAVS